jgi:hypothetical protein
MDLLCLLLCIVRAHCFASSIVTPWGYKNKRLPLRIPTSSHTISRCLLPSFLAPRERERGRERGDFWGLESVSSSSPSSHGRIRLNSFHGHAGPSVEPHEPEVHDGGRSHDLSHAQGPHVPVLVEGYMMSFVAFYERGFGVPSH